MTVQDIKNYLRLDDDGDDVLLKSLFKAAQKYVEEKTGKTCPKNDEVWNICIKILVAHWYENRQAQAVSTRSNLVTVDHTVDALIMHIALSGAYE